MIKSEESLLEREQTMDVAFELSGMRSLHEAQFTGVDHFLEVGDRPGSHVLEAVLQAALQIRQEEQRRALVCIGPR